MLALINLINVHAFLEINKYISTMTYLDKAEEMFMYLPTN